MKKPIVKKVKWLRCHVCDNKATHVVLIELREKPGPPLKENNVLRVVCADHVNNDFDHWVPIFAFKSLCAEWKKVGVTLDKKYCNINILPLKNDNTKS